jgi:RimJ/RimL family protein N-acetyltransferase
VSVVPVLVTERLTLREWRPEDLAGFAALNADARVMEHFPGVLSPERSDAVADRLAAQWADGFGPWALEQRETGAFIGYVGFVAPTFRAHFTPAIEIGWRIAHDMWGRGYATEAARASLGWARSNLSPPRGEIVSFTTVANVLSRRVMGKLGFSHRDEDDFDHPLLRDWEFRRHVLYRLRLVASNT